ncbi:MAG: GFA family protein [Pseudomonadota bacterium]
MKRYTGSCHCGAVQFAFKASKIDRATRCNCSICVRKGILMSTEVVPPEQIEIADPDSLLATYQFATNVAQHHFCSRCGVHTFIEIRRKPEVYRINLGCVDELDAMQLPTEVFDGKSL